jgi:hypothetical protein
MELQTRGGEIVKNTQFESTIAEIIDIPTGDFKHPFLTKIKFIFADNRGNANDQGIEAEDFDALITSSIHMPIKMRYTHAGVKGHDMSVPIGHITAMTKQIKDNEVAELIGEAVLYNEEYPDEVSYLKEKYAAGEAPGISWELVYQDVKHQNGIDWLKGVITRAATFVQFPAYGSRTSLLAIAQTNIQSISQSQLEDEEFMSELTEIVQELNDLIKGKVEEEEEPSITMGGMKVDELEKAQADLAAAEAKIAELESKLEEATSTINTLTEEKTSLASENEAFKRDAIVAERTAKVSEAGVKVEDDVLAQKQELWLSMSQEIFDAYVADLAAAIKEAPKAAASASTKKESLPKFAVAGTDEMSLDDLKSLGRRASRGEIADL